MKNYNLDYQLLVSMAKIKMAMNAHKGDIEDISIPLLIQFAKDELDELGEALMGGESNQILVIEEAADVVNYMVAAVRKATEAYKNRKELANEP